MKSAGLNEQNYKFKINIIMKRETSILVLTKAFFILLVMCCFSLDSFAGAIIPIPIFTGGGGGSREDLISLWLAINLFFIIYFIGRIIVYPLFKNKIKWTKKWWQFIITDSFSYDMDMNISFAMWTFIGINGMALLFTTADWIGTVLK